MKTTLALTIATLIFLATPALASAHGKQYDGRSHQYNGRAKVHYDDHRQNRHVKRHLKQDLREARRELRHFKRHSRHDRRHRHYYAQPGVIIGIPHVVFRFDL